MARIPVAPMKWDAEEKKVALAAALRKKYRQVGAVSKQSVSYTSLSWQTIFGPFARLRLDDRLHEQATI
jgi:hypothetical protein